MGHVRHHAIIVTASSSSLELLEMAAETALAYDCKISPIASSPFNSFASFCVFPDGSNELWEGSAAGDGQRNSLIDMLESERLSNGSSPFSWVEVQYGDDRYDTRVTRDSDETLRAALNNTPSGDAFAS